MNERIRRPSLLIESLRAHVLLFERPLDPEYSSEVGARMLAAFFAVGIVLFLGLRLALRAWGAGELPSTRFAFVAALLAAFIMGQRAIVRAPWASIGLRRPAQWTRRERLYLLQIAPIAAAMFAVVFRDHLQGLLQQHGLVGFAIFSVLTGLAWGVVQEFLYRGWLQTELTRRFGSVAGLFVANVVFVFGPLHFASLFGADCVYWGTLAAVFGIGLVFGLVYQRSGNLWIPALLHGLWPLNMV